MPDLTMNEVVIVGAARTPIGSFGGSLSQIPATKLGATAITGALKRCGLPKSTVEACYMGNVLSAGVGQAPARQAALEAGLPESCASTTVNKVCASGLKAVMMGAADITMGNAKVVVAGGMENMSMTPHYLRGERFGQLRLGDATLVDGITHDALTDAFGQGHMSLCAEHCAQKYHIDRNEQDEYARESYNRARMASEQGLFVNEIEPVPIPVKKHGSRSNNSTNCLQSNEQFKFVEKDEECYRYSPEGLVDMRPVFIKDGSGTVTSGNASGINDGAAAVVLMDERYAEEQGIKPLARIVSFADAATTSLEFTIAPSLALPKALEKASLGIDQIDVLEINEAFSVVAETNLKLLRLSSSNVNVWGGAVSLGHPVGCSGTRILVTMLSVMATKNVRRGAAAICNGGGGASAMVVERSVNAHL